MAIEAPKLNLFAQGSQMQPISSTKAVRQSFEGATGESSSAKSNTFSGKTVGINEATMNSPVYTAASAGKKAGVAGALFQAIG